MDWVERLLFFHYDKSVIPFQDKKNPSELNAYPSFPKETVGLGIGIHEQIQETVIAAGHDEKPQGGLGRKGQSATGARKDVPTLVSKSVVPVIKIPSRDIT